MGILLFIIGVSVGSLIVWVLIHNRIRTEIIGREGKIKATESTVTELRAQLQQKDTELNNLRSTLNTEQQARVSAEIRLEEAQKKP